jgi:hypothetical protein
MLSPRVMVLAVALTSAAVLVACAKPRLEPPQAQSASPTASPETVEASPTTAAPSPTPSPSPSRKPSPKPTTTLKKSVPAGGDIPSSPPQAPINDGVPARGAGTFAVAGGGTEIAGTGATLVKYRIELEEGIEWGTYNPWTPTGFASTVDQIVAHPRGWTRSAESPITNRDEHMTDASWSFQRVSGDDYSVRVRLATPDTVDRLCGQAGVNTRGVYSCRFGTTIMINLRRWLNGAAGFSMDVAAYRHMVIDHEMGHFLGFDHMKCPGSGRLAPVMQTQTIALNGCNPNAYPFTADGVFVTGTWTAS